MTTDEASSYTGDFALLNPPPMLRDEDGQYRCPAPIWQRVWAEDDSDCYTTAKALCGEPLAVMWTIATTVPDHDGEEPVIRAEDASKWRLWSTWKLECPHGHVLVTSEDGEGSEDAQPFDARLVWG